MSKNYDAVKDFLVKKVLQQNISTLIPLLMDAVSLSVREVNEALEMLADDKVIVMVNDMVYVVDDIHYMIGTLRVIRGKFAFVGEGEDSIYIGSEDFANALDSDVVLIHVEHADETKGKVITVLKRTKEYVLGTMVQTRHGLEFVSYDRKIPNRIVFDAGNQSIEVDQRIIAKIDTVSHGILYVKLESVLGMVDEPGIDVLSVLFSYDLETEFSSATLDEAAKFPKRIALEDLAGRIDHRDQNAITIDGEDAKDLDDAIYLEPLHDGYRLYVHIADVSHYVKENSAIDQSAQARTSSIYMVDRVVPMLPKELSNGLCSLHPGVDRLVLTCKMDIDLKGDIYNYEVYPAVINSKRRMSYNEVNDSDDFGQETEMIYQMKACASLLQKKRSEKGAIDFDSDESQFIVDAQGKVLDIIPREQREAESMIEAFMVSANESIAKYVRYLEIPSLYRVHEKPDLDKMKALSHMFLIMGYRMKGNLSDVHPAMLQRALHHFENDESLGVVSRLMLRSMKKARYDTHPLGHFGLALDDYAHFTAPIRRYSDLLLHRSLHKYIFEHNFKDLQEDLLTYESEAVHISECERTILDAEREVEKMKKAEFMSDKVGEIYEGIVGGFSNFGMYVELANTVEGVVPLKTMRDDFYTFDANLQKLVGERTGVIYSLGQKVTIKVDGIDPLEHDVIFKLRVKRDRKEFPNRRKRSELAVDNPRKGRRSSQGGRNHGVKRRKKQKSIS